ncbi:hypothetical protein BRC81_15095 [Halobacteriales archaeon QS_1_68_20]|nr:MAG: hypothetical protein BRC81_15095 [Halobacteriales archaeon QS_1_68_20]
MSNDTPRPERPAKDRGMGARTGNDPTWASYLSSLLYLLSVPLLVFGSYAGHWAGLYPYRLIIPVFGGTMLGLVALAFAVMHVTSG